VMKYNMQPLKPTKMNIPIIYIMLFLFLVTKGCKEKENFSRVDIEDLPLDTGGVQYPTYLDPEHAPYGYYLYLPSGYENTDMEYPLLVFLHGAGEKGNSGEDPSKLSKVLKNGPPKLIEKKEWNPPYPMVVLSPQCHDSWWIPGKVHELTRVISEELKINKQRIYLTGLSMGGFGTFSYLEYYGDTGLVAAAIPICGGGNVNKAGSLLNFPLWAFHGDADEVVDVSKSINMIEAINEMNPALKPKLTIYPGIGHNSWSMTYDGSGMGKETPDHDSFNTSIYSWLMNHTKKRQE